LQRLHLVIMISGYMTGTYETKKYGTDKITLLGLFIVALLIARFIIASRAAIVLSEPIELEYGGLSASIPAGNGWRSEKRWKYQENAFTLSSYFDSGSGVTALAHCRYLLAATDAPADVLFAEKASAVGGVIVKTGQTRTDKYTIDWVHIRKPEILFDTFFGTARLPDNRQFDIEVFHGMDDAELAERVFKHIAGSLKFKDNQLLEAGSEIIAGIKSKGLSSFLGSLFAKEVQNGVPLDNQIREDFFLVKDVRKGTIGFAMDLLGLRFVKGQDFPESWQDVSPGSPQNGIPLSDLTPDAQLNIQTVSFHYIRGRYEREQTTFFQSRNNLDEFIWKSETSDTGGRVGTEIVLDRTGGMTVKRFGPRAKENDYRICSAAIPDVLSELIFSQMLDSHHKKIFVDIIEAEGTVLPTLVSRVEAEDFVAAERDGVLQTFYEAGDEQEFTYVFRLDFLDGRGFSQQLYLDDQRRISKILLRQERIYLLERTSLKDIVGQFPERADYILGALQKNKMLEQSQPWENSE